MELRVVKSGKTRDGFYAVIQKVFDGVTMHCVMYSAQLLEENSVINLERNLNTIKWYVSGDDGSENVRKPPEYNGGYRMNDILKFGLYKGYEIGVVYAFDIKYLEWCIENIEDFFIIDIDELHKIGVFKPANQFEHQRNLGFAEYIPFITAFKSIQELKEAIPFLNTNVRLAKVAYFINDERLGKFRK